MAAAVAATDPSPPRAISAAVGRRRTRSAAAAKVVAVSGAMGRLGSSIRLRLVVSAAVAGGATGFVHSVPSLHRCGDSRGPCWKETSGTPGVGATTWSDAAQAHTVGSTAAAASAAVAGSAVALTVAAVARARRHRGGALRRRGPPRTICHVGTIDAPKVSQQDRPGKDGRPNKDEDEDKMASEAAPALVAAAAAAKEEEAKQQAQEVRGGGAFAEGGKKKDNEMFEGVDAATRFLSAGWETFIEAATSTKKKDKGWEYRKGIEGMSMGSLWYEMLNTSEKTDSFERLKDEYEGGWGVPFVNLSARKISTSLRDASMMLGLDSVWLVFVNLLQTVGVDGELIDGIPVQNKWMTIVRDSMAAMGAKEPDQGSEQAKAFMKNMVTGQMERIAGAPMPIFLEAYGESSGIFKIVIGPRSVVVVSDPVIVKHVLQGSQQNFTKGILSEVLEPIMGKGLIPADPETWKVRRKAIVPGFHKKWLKKTTELINGCAQRLCKDLERNLMATDGDVVTVNMEEKFTSASLDIIGKAVFDYDFGSVDRESPMIKAVFSVLREAERRAQSVIPYWNLPGASRLFRDQKSHEENLLLLNAVLDELIRKAMELPEDLGDASDGHLSLLQYLVLTKNQDVSTKQLRDDLMTLLIAGHETTAALLTWALHELMKPKNQDIYQQVMDEIDSVVGDREFVFEDMAKMPILKYVLLETLRLYPEPPLLIRRCIEGDEIPVGPTCKGVTGDTVSMLPGQDIFISTWSLQRSTVLWGEDANEFKPLRWQKPIPADGRWQGYKPEKATPYPNEAASDFAFVPFGGGPRKCIGDQFAMLEATIVLAMLLQRYSFEPLQKSLDEVGLDLAATIHTKRGLRMRVRERGA
mmetsp:Transcript_97329/g.251635  ORF Transcript_97329/g.251635 Transcript_97329/m.251635 type:complete len:865 (+) Transcript_97329:117-2711(+)